jgi:hypothetical protein
MRKIYEKDGSCVVAVRSKILLFGQRDQSVRVMNGYGMVACGRAKRTLGCGNRSVRG